MSEEKYEEKVLKLLETIAEQIKQPKITKIEAASTESSEPKHEHWKADELLTSSCPECQKEIEKIGKNWMQKSLKERKDYPFECEECGTHVRQEEENCPTCGGRKAKRR